MKQVFKSNNINNYNLRSEQHLILPRTKTVTYGLGSLKYMGYKTWNNVPITIRKLETIGQFKLEIKSGMKIIATANSAKIMFKIQAIYNK